MGLVQGYCFGFAPVVGNTMPALPTNQKRQLYNPD